MGEFPKSCCLASTAKLTKLKMIVKKNGGYACTEPH